VDFVSNVIKEEEAAFLRTVANGIQTFTEYQEGVKKIYDGQSLEKFEKYREAIKNNIVAGEFAFELYDTYGFPLDLTKLMAKERTWNVDEEGFSKYLQQQKERSRAATALDTEDWVTFAENSVRKFVGYDSLEIQTRVIKYRKVTAKSKESFQLVLDSTPFYAESGGQVGDTGVLIFDGEMVPVYDTRKENDLIIHFSEKLPVNITAPVDARVDAARRKQTAVHHTATHLVHAALRKVLGTHVAQKGSLVNDEHLRFDFSHFARMTEKEIHQVETLVNEKIRENIPVVIREMPKDEAIAMGAMALFGEKYGDIVRVVIIDPSYSVELCGGTHVTTTGELGFFRIKHETAVAAGVRRVEAVSGEAAEKYADEQFSLLQQLKETLKNPADLLKAVENLQNENSELKKKLEQQEGKLLAGLRDELVQKAEKINGVAFVGAVVEVTSADALKKLCFEIKSRLDSYVAVLAANISGKASVAVGIADGVVSSKSLDAGKIIKEHVAPLIKGGGGGQKNLATAGGQDADNLQLVINKVKSLL